MQGDIPVLGVDRLGRRTTVSRVRGIYTQDGRVPTGATAPTKRRRRIKVGLSRSQENKIPKLFKRARSYLLIEPDQTGE